MKHVTLTQKQKDAYVDAVEEAMGWLDEHAPTSLLRRLSVVASLIKRIPTLEAPFDKKPVAPIIEAVDERPKDLEPKEEEIDERTRRRKFLSLM